MWLTGRVVRSVRRLDEARRDYLEAIRLAETTAAAQADARRAYEESQGALLQSRWLLDESARHLGLQIAALAGRRCDGSDDYDA